MVIFEDAEACIAGVKAQLRTFQEETRKRNDRGEIGTRQLDRGRAGDPNAVRRERETIVRTVISALRQVRAESVKPL